MQYGKSAGKWSQAYYSDFRHLPLANCHHIILLFAAITVYSTTNQLYTTPPCSCNVPMQYEK